MGYTNRKLLGITSLLFVFTVQSRWIITIPSAFYTIQRPTMTTIQPYEHWIILHGTYAKRAKWYQPEGDFYEELKVTIPSSSRIHSFEWSGKLSHKARLQAAQQLITFIETHTSYVDRINIIGHSHGATVAVLAAGLLKEKKSSYRIFQLFTLAPPIFKEYSTPDMETIDYLFNIFSFGDLIQSVCGRSKRIYTDHTQIWNIELKRDGLSLDHSDIHCTEIAQLLPQLQALVKGNNTTVLHLQTGKEYSIEEDFDRHTLLIHDQKKHKNIFRFTLEGIRRKYPQRILLKIIRISYEKLNEKARKFTLSRWYTRLRNRRN